MILVLSLILTGCGGGNHTEAPLVDNHTPTPGTTPQTNSPDSLKMAVTSRGPTSHPSEETVKKFLTTLLEGNTQGTVALLTPLAQEQYAKNSFYLNSLSSFTSGEFQEVVFRVTGSDLASESDPNYFAVYVNVIINNDVDDPTPTVWLVRKNGVEYRVAGMLFIDDETGSEVTYDFEGQLKPDGTPVRQQASSDRMQQSPQADQHIAQPNTPNFQ